MFSLLRIPAAIELPFSIHITGDPKKDAEYVLLGLALCVLLLIITISILVIVALRKNKKKNVLVAKEKPSRKQEISKTEKTKATIQAEKNNDQKYSPPIEKPKEKAPENQAPPTPPKPEEIKEEKVAESTKKEEKATVKKEEAKPQSAPDKMEEIRLRLAEIAKNKKENPDIYKDVVLPKLDENFAKTVSKEEAGLCGEAYEDHETEIVDESSPEQSNSEAEQSPVHNHPKPEQAYNYERKLQQLDTDLDIVIPVSDSDYKIEEEEHIESPSDPENATYTTENTETGYEPEEELQHLDTDLDIENPVSDSDYKIEEEQIEIISGDNSREDNSAQQQIPSSHAGNFRNSGLPLKRLTFAEWMENFKN